MKTEKKIASFLKKRKKNVSKWPCKNVYNAGAGALHHQHEGYIYAEHAQAGNTLLCSVPLLRFAKSIKREKSSDVSKCVLDISRALLCCTVLLAQSRAEERRASLTGCPVIRKSIESSKSGVRALTQRSS